MAPDGKDAHLTASDTDNTDTEAASARVEPQTVKPMAYLLENPQ